MSSLRINSKLFYFILMVFALPCLGMAQGDGDDQNDTETEDGGGIFEDKTKAKSGGPTGYDPSNPWADPVHDCFSSKAVFNEVHLSVQINLDFAKHPCDIYVGISIEGAPTIYRELGSNNTISLPTIDYDPKKCIDGIFAISYEVDLFCHENGVFTPISPCDSDMFDEILPDELEDECSLATTLTYEHCCGDETTTGNEIPDPQTSDNPNPTPDPTPGPRNINTSNSSQMYIYSIDGRMVYNNKLSKDVSVNDVLLTLPINSGLYFISTENNGMITTRKVIKP